MPADLDALVRGEHHDPHSLLGRHGDLLRVLRPDATRVRVHVGRRRIALERVHVGGVFEGTIPDGSAYRVEATYADGNTHVVDDGYRFPPALGELDLHLLGEGRHERLWHRLGARVATRDGVTGVEFAVWAPNARGIRIVGDFNVWDGRAHPMRNLGASGVWDLFLPEAGDGTRYKYVVLGADGAWREKADPLAFAAEHPPANGSVVYTSQHEWSDEGWLARREQAHPHQEALSVYEVHLGSWRPGLSYDELAEQLPAYVAELGFTHVELLPVAEHPFGGSWGYQVSSYYAPTSRFGDPDGLRRLIDALHRADIGVLLDWVPAHFPRDAWALARFDGTALYEHADPRLGEHPDWGTLVFNFARHEVRNFLLANALFWLEEFHIDGLRVDAVASMLYLDYSRKAGQWLPNAFGGRENLDAVDFLRELNTVVHREHPGVLMMAEESTAWPGVTSPAHAGGLGFGFKWNLGWMHDTLGYVSRDPMYRRHHHHEMTFSLMYAHSENFLLPLSHDEVVHGKGSLLRKMPGDQSAQCATLRALFGYMWAHPGKQLLFMGAEIAQPEEWDHEVGLRWDLLEWPDHSGMQRLVGDLNRAYREHRALWSQDGTNHGFHWLAANDIDANVFAFLRWGDDGSALACVTNFSGRAHDGYRLGLPHSGQWREVINTDAQVYAGSGGGNFGAVPADQPGWHEQPHSALLHLPALCTLWLAPDGT